MTRLNLSDLLDEDYDPSSNPRGKQIAAVHLHRAHRERYNDHAVVDDILAHADEPEAVTASAFTPTFSSSRYERIWILNYLGPFYDKGEIADVLRKVKGGKEANVYCCSGGPNAALDLIAAKVYRPRQFRNLRNDALYRQGREIMGPRGEPVRDRRALHAIHMGTRKGKEMQHVSWLAHEYATLQLLHCSRGARPEARSLREQHDLDGIRGGNHEAGAHAAKRDADSKRGRRFVRSPDGGCGADARQRPGARRPIGVQRALLATATTGSSTFRRPSIRPSIRAPSRCSNAM